MAGCVLSPWFGGKRREEEKKGWPRGAAFFFSLKLSDWR